MTTYEVRLLGGFVLLAEGAAVRVRKPVARLVALLALEGGRCTRSVAASTLWPEVREQRALANLRSIFCQAGLDAPGLVEGNASALWLSPMATTDCSASPAPWVSNEELLPGWDDEWLVLPRFLEHQILTVTNRATSPQTCCPS
jgi:hypothetical protein